MYSITFDPEQHGMNIFLYLWIEQLRHATADRPLSVCEFYDLLKMSVKATVLVKIKEDMKAFKESDMKPDKFTYQEGIELIIADLRDCKAFDKREIHSIIKQIKLEWRDIVDSK